jgi:hypothetical protein
MAPRYCIARRASFHTLPRHVMSNEDAKRATAAQKRCTCVK